MAFWNRSKTPPAAAPDTGAHLKRVASAMLLGVQPDAHVDREQAMTVPSVAACRWIITTMLSKHPIRFFDRRGLAEPDAEPKRIPTPRWLTQTSGADSPQRRLLDTFDDMYFYGWACWLIRRGSEERIREATHLPIDQWEFRPRSETSKLFDVWIDPDGEDVYRLGQDSEICLFRSPMDPLLWSARHTITGALMLEKAWTDRVANVIPLVELRVTNNNSVLPEELKGLVDEYKEARRESAAVMGTPYGVELNAHGDVHHELFTDARNFAVLDIARHSGVPAALIGASQVAASLTYSTREGNRVELYDITLQPWATAIESRLSMDDITPAGTYCAFDLTGLVTAIEPTGTQLED